MNKTCVITGTGGYLGGCVRDNFTRAGWDVRPLSRATGFQLGADVSPESLRGADALVHCAYDFTKIRRADIWQTNVRGTEKLFAAAREAGVAKCVLISTISAFEGCKSLYGKAKLECEKMALGHGALVIRPGLIWGDRPGGMLGKLVAQVEKSKIIPLIGDGTQPQYLVHEEDLCGFIVRYCGCEVPQPSGPVTAANEKVWMFREILAEIARIKGKTPTFIKLPWRAIWLAIKVAETLGVRSNFRSDSVVSLMHQNPTPSFQTAHDAGLRCRQFRPPVTV